MVQSSVSQKRDLGSGALIFAIGVGATLLGLQYPIGTLADIGPGLFPTVIGILLAVTGLAIGATRLESRYKRSDAAPDWRGWGCIVGGILAFAVLGLYFGLAVASFAIVFISALGDRNNSIPQAAMLAAAMVVVSIIVFWWALQLQMPLFKLG
ncbi:tripartite tricarboxylate transporter TctB family protein [Nitrobacteraceae bacterium UC4446_H13]|jgi:hypothetical protein